jgi:NHL repeat
MNALALATDVQLARTGLSAPGRVQRDGYYGDQTKLDHPLDVAATSAATYVVADTGNNRIREFGPSPLDEEP